MHWCVIKERVGEKARNGRKKKRESERDAVARVCCASRHAGVMCERERERAGRRERGRGEGWGGVPSLERAVCLDAPG